MSHSWRSGPAAAGRRPGSLPRKRSIPPGSRRNRKFLSVPKKSLENLAYCSLTSSLVGQWYEGMSFSEILFSSSILVIEFYIGRNNANTEGRKPLYRVYKVGPVKLYTVVSMLRF